MINDLLSHWIANTITIDEDVIGKGAIMITEGLESTLEVSLKNTRADDFLSFLTLRASLCVIFTHMLIIGSTESNDTLLSFMTYVNTHKHSLPWNLRPKVEPPQITAKLGINLSQDIDIDPIIVFLNGFTRYELRDNWAVSVYFVFESSVKMLLFYRIRHDDEEEV